MSQQYINKMKNLVFETPNFRIFKVKFVAPTNTRGSRVQIVESKRYNDDKVDKVTLSYDYAIGDVQEQAMQYLKSKGFNIVARASELEHYYILCDNRGENFLNLKGENKND